MNQSIQPLQFYDVYSIHDTSLQLIHELMQTKTQVDKIIRTLLKSLPDYVKVEWNAHHGYHDLASSQMNLNDLTLPRYPIKEPQKIKRCHSWPAQNCSFESITLLFRVEIIALKVLQTPVIALIDTSMTQELIKSLQAQLNQQRQSNSSEAHDLLSQLLFVLAPLLRIIESLVISHSF